MHFRALLVLVACVVAGCGRGGQPPDPAQKGSNTVPVPAVTANTVPVPTTSWQPPAGLAHPERSIRVGFWLDTKNNEILTPAMIDWIGDRASIVVLNAEEKGPDPAFDYRTIVKRFKARNPGLPVLVYDTAHRVQSNTRVAGADYAAVTKTPGWVLKTTAGQPFVQKLGKAGPDRVWIDITNADYRKHLPRQVVTDLDRTGADGVAFDGYHRDLPRPHRPASFFQNGKDLEARWPKASTELLAGVKSAAGNRIVLYNGLWVKWDGQLAAQASLLSVADGASVEFFGYDGGEPPTGRPTEFDRFVLQIQKVMKANPDKLYMVFGRTRRATYDHYEQEYQVQRYVLASYLLGMTPRSTFKFQARFPTFNMSPDRSNGLSYYADWDLDVGTPATDAFVVDGVHQRRFTKALIVVAPAWQGEKTVRLDRVYFTPEGERREGTVRLPSGTGLILLTEKAPAAPARIVVDDFEAGEAGMWKFPGRDDRTMVATEGGNRYLQIRLAKDAIQPYHERLLQPIRRMQPLDKVTLRVRSSDPNGALLVRVEVDDATPIPARPAAAPAAAGDRDDDNDENDPPARGPAARGAGAAAGVTPPGPRAPRIPRGGPRAFAVVAVLPQGSSRTYRKRERDIPYGELTPKPTGIPYVIAPARYAADGRWQTVTVDAPAILRSLAPNLTARRVSELRVLGDADLDDVVITR